MTGVGSEPSNVRRLKYQNVGYDCESFVAFGYCGDMWVEAFAFLVASQLLTNRRSSADTGPLSANDTESQFVGQSVTHFFAEHPSSLVATVTDSTFTSAELFFSTGVAMQGG
jgi:hypothetical protein